MSDGKTKKLKKKREEDAAAADPLRHLIPQIDDISDGKRKKLKKTTDGKTKKLKKTTGGKTKKLKKTREEDAAETYYAPISPLEMKAKKQQQKMKVRKKQRKMKARKKHQKKSASPEYYDSSLPSKKAADGFESPSPSTTKTKTKGTKTPNSSELYFVVRHAVLCPAYSLYMLEHTITTAEHPLPIPWRVKYLDADQGMSFAAVSSQRRSWIVGVGGFPDYKDPQRGGRGQTMVFDCKTGLVAKGPPPSASKYEPVLFVLGEKVYALSRMPSIWHKPDLLPWFELLDVSDASCTDGQLTHCSWRALPSPPLFPILIDEGVRIDEGPAIVDVESYAVFGHYILLSIVTDPFTGREAGTVAFDTSTEEWHFVDHQKNLPFTGEAVPYDGLYLGRSKSKDWCDLTAYNISLTWNKTDTTAKLSIVEVPITIETTNNLPLMSGQFFFSLGNGVICAVGCCTQSWTFDEDPKKDDICISIHRRVDADEESKTQRSKEIALSNNPAEYAFTVREQIYQLIAPSLVAALHVHMI